MTRTRMLFTNVLFVISATALFFSFQFKVSAQQASSISGRIVYQGQEQPVSGAIVRVEELPLLEATSGRDGQFRISDVPPGSYSLLIDYLGLGEQRYPVTVTSGQSNPLLIEFRGDELETLVVVGTLAGFRGARNRERISDNFKTVVGADAVGQFADQNVAESLQRLPGLSVQRDEGEGRFVSVRGLSPDFNKVTVNGVQLGSGGDGFDFSDLGGSRTVSLDIVPSDLLESIEVTKSRMADMDGDVVGGAIELQSLSAFDRGGFSAGLRLEASHNDFAGETSPKISGQFTDIIELASGQLGVAGAVHWFNRDVQLNDLRSTGVRSVSTGGRSSNPEFLTPKELDPRVEIGTRERRGVTLNFDYRPNSGGEYYLNFTNTNLQDDDVRNQLRVDLDDARRGELLEVGRLSGTFEDVDLERRISIQEKENDITTLALGGKNEFNDWIVEYNATYSENDYRLPEGSLSRFKISNTETQFTVGDDSYTAIFRPESGADDDEDPSNLDNFVLDRVNIFSDRRTDEIFSVKFDLTKSMKFGKTPGLLKFGMKYNTREKRADRTQALESGDDDVLGEPSIADLELFAPNNDLDGFNAFPTRGAVQDLVRSLIPALEENSRSGNNVITSTANRTRRDYVAEEDVLAAYLMSTMDLSEKLRLTAGVRVEQTDWSALAFEVERINRVDRRDGINGVLPDQALAPIARQVERDYTDVLPSLHLRYEPNENTIVRAAISTAIQRPAFNDAVPVIDVLSDQQEVNDEGSFEREIDLLGNPDLEPLEAVQFDWSITWYPGKDTVMSAGVFYKELDNFFIRTSLDGDDVRLLGFEPGNGRAGNAGGGVDIIDRYTLNGDSAEVWGIELALAHTLRNGFFIQSNVTLSDSEADLGELLELARGNNDTVPLPDQADILANLSIGWENPKWTLRSSWTYRDDQLVDPKGNPEADELRDDYFSWDIGIKYQLNEMTNVYADFINLTEEKDVQVFRGDDTGRFFERSEDFGRTFQLGVNMKW